MTSVPESLRRRAESESEAKRRYLGILRRAIRCVHSTIEPRFGPQVDRSGRLALVWSLHPIEVRQPDGASLYLVIDQSFDFGPHPDYVGEMKLFTRSYWYAAYDSPDVEHVPALVAWHWNSSNEPWSQPHIHAPVQDPHGRGLRLHIPSGARMTVEQVLAFLIREELVKPTHDGWENDLAEGELRYQTFQTQDQSS